MGGLNFLPVIDRVQVGSVLQISYIAQGGNAAKFLIFFSLYAIDVL